SIVPTCPRDSQPEKTAEDGRVDRCEVDQIRLLLSLFPLQLTAKNRTLPEGQCHRDRIGKAAETRSHVGSGGEAREADVESHRSRVDEITGALPFSREAPGVHPRDPPPGEQPDGALDVHRDTDRAA